MLPIYSQLYHPVATFFEASYLTVPFPALVKCQWLLSLRWDFVPFSPSLDFFVCFESTQILCRYSQSLWVHLYSWPCHHPPPLVPTILPPPFHQRLLSLGKKRCNIDVPFRVECCEVANWPIVGLLIIFIISIFSNRSFSDEGWEMHWSLGIMINHRESV